MASGNVTIYSANKNQIQVSSVITATVKLALVTSAYSPNVAVAGDSLWSAASANELANGNGYTTGGITLATVTSAQITGGYKVSSAAAVWTASGTGIPAWRYGVLYLSGTVWGLVNPLIGYFVGDSTPADIPLTTSGNTLTVNCPAGGWFDLT